jgi:Relaxase/Mobilisation nuclease domain/Large polyvalent protein-associated domain 7
VIAKLCKPKANAAPKSKGLHARDLTSYIMEVKEDERILHRGAANFLGDDFEMQQVEMMALANEAVRSPNPTRHWVLSWNEGEQPTAEQADQAARMFLDHLGLSEHQAMWALHGNTHNVHMHIVVNRVHPETGRVTKVNGGWEIKAGHQAAALIEHAQGWQRQDRALYRVERDGNGRAVPVPAHQRETVRQPSQEREQAARPEPAPEPRQPSAKARDMEARTGEKSAERIAAEQGAPVMRAAKTWRELHEGLAAKGMRYERKGSGGLLWVGEDPVKPSAAGRDCSMGALEKRLGEFEPAPPELTRPLSPERQQAKGPERPPIVHLNARVGWHEYAKGRREHYAAKNAAWEELRARHQAEWAATVKRHRQERQQALGGSWKGRGEVLNALRSQFAARQAAEKAAMTERRQLERKELRGRFPRYRDFEDWLREERSPNHAEGWRYRRDIREPAPAGITSAREEKEPQQPAPPRDIRDFEGEAKGWSVEYRARSDSGWRRAAFVDRGKQIDIYAKDKNAVLAALQLANEKWAGHIVVYGNDEFKRRCVEIAVEHRINIANPELQQAIAAERERRRELERPRPAEPRSREDAPEKPAGPQRAVEREGGERKPDPAARPSPSPEQAAPAAPSSSLPSPVRTPGDAYRRHWEDITRAQASRGRIDVSRVDALVAVRMRMTGYDQVTVERTVLEAAKARANEKREWDAYAKRTASFAFGFAGTRKAAELEPGRARFFQLEGRDQHREIAERQQRALEQQRQREAAELERQRKQRDLGPKGPGFGR